MGSYRLYEDSPIYFYRYRNIFFNIGGTCLSINSRRAECAGRICISCNCLVAKCPTPKRICASPGVSNPRDSFTIKSNVERSRLFVIRANASPIVTYQVKRYTKNSQREYSSLYTPRGAKSGAVADGSKVCA